MCPLTNFDIQPVVLGAAARVYRALGLKQALQYAPVSVRSWVDDLKLKRRERLVPEKALMRTYHDGLERLMNEIGRGAIGDYLEFGVYDGTSLCCMYKVLRQLGLNHVRLFGFDSFEGLPECASIDDEGHWKPGQFASSYELTERVLKVNRVDRSRVALIKGFYDKTLVPETARQLGTTKASVIMVDCDMYLSASDALRFSAPLIRDRALIIFDDWNPLAARNMGEKRAFDEFLAANTDCSVEEMPTYASNAKVFYLSRSLR